MIREALHTYATTTGRRWTTDRSQTVGASEIGGCCRRVAFEKHQADEASAVVRDADHEEGWGATRRGSVIEDAFWAPAMAARYGDDLLWAGQEQQTFVSGFLSATPDGVLVNQPDDALADLGVPSCGGQILLDCKSSDPRSRLDRPKDEHVYQVIVGMGIVREVTNYQPEWAVLSYIDASFWDRVIEFPVRFDADVFTVAKDRARQIMTARHGADLRPEGIIAGGRECDFCGFTRQCGVARAARVPETSKVITSHIETLITALARDAKIKGDLAKAAKAEEQRIKQDIRDELQAAGTRGIPGVVSWASLRGQEKLDVNALCVAAEAAGLCLDDFKVVGDPSDRVTITLKA